MAGVAGNCLDGLVCEHHSNNYPSVTAIFKEVVEKEGFGPKIEGSECWAVQGGIQRRTAVTYVSNGILTIL